MAEAAPVSNINQQSVPKLAVCQTFLRGRISYSRTVKTEKGRLHLTILKIPAPDQYSHPSIVEIGSENRLGEINDDWSGICQVSGFPRTFDSKPDPETGEVKVVRTANINLRVVE